MVAFKFLIRILGFFSIVLYTYFFIFSLLKNGMIQKIYRISLFLLKNKEIGEALFIIFFLLLPISIMIWISKKIMVFISK